MLVLLSGAYKLSYLPDSDGVSLAFQDTLGDRYNENTQVQGFLKNVF